MQKWQRLAIFAALPLAWVVFAAWQYHGYGHECDLIQETLRQQSHSVMNAMIGGVKSHRGLGRFFHAQVEGLVNELAAADDVLAASIVSKDLDISFSAGEPMLLDVPLPMDAGGSLKPMGFRLVERFEIDAAPPGRVPEGGRGMGRGGGRRWPSEAGALGNAHAAGGEFIAVLVLDRTRSDALCRSAAWSHAVVTLAGALVLLCVALAWLASVRLVDTQGRAKLLETEARYLREMSQAAAGLAHETRNPLGLVRGWTQRLAKDAEDSPELRHQAQAVIEECDRVTARINQFLAYARPCEPSLSDVDSRDVVEHLAVILQPDIEAKNMQLRHSEIPAGHTIRADRELLRQALFNLVQNAIQMSPAGSAVDLAITAGRHGACRFDVADRGPGVADDVTDSLFTPYFTTRPDGTGLGLAIVRRIASAHGWQAAYSARPGGGAVFSLEGIHG